MSLKYEPASEPLRISVSSPLGNLVGLTAVWDRPDGNSLI